MGSTHSNKTIEESLAYIDLQYSDYRKYAGLEPSRLKGKTVLELGCGDNVGVALRFLADGAAKVVCLDKFYSIRDLEKERRIYLELRQRLSTEQRKSFDEIVSLSKGIVIDPERLLCVYGVELEEFASDSSRPVGPFDIVVSRAVIEEIYEPDSLFQAADRLLKPGGLMSHKIDLSDYGMFSNAGMNPLTFLTIPEWIYRRMAAESAMPNRRLIGYYRNSMARLGYDTIIYASSIIDSGDLMPHKQKIEFDVDYGKSELELIREIRSKLNKAFVDLPDEDLLVSGIFLVARKPERPGVMTK
jgi:SAM-dependent methyltransferase